MARFDKVDPKDGSFRAKLDAAIVAADAGKVFGVGLNADGRVVRGAGNTGVKGVICATEAMAAGDPIDVMTDGELADFKTLNDGTTALTAGTNYYAAAGDGDISTTNTGTLIGWTVDIADGRGRFIVRVAR